MHGSQREIKGERLNELNAEYASLGNGHFIELECVINYELKQLLMSMMDRMVVLTPQPLASEFKERISNLARMYEKVSK